MGGVIPMQMVLDGIRKQWNHGLAKPWRTSSISPQCLHQLLPSGSHTVCVPFLSVRLWCGGISWNTTFPTQVAFGHGDLSQQFRNPNKEYKYNILSLFCGSCVYSFKISLVLDIQLRSSSLVKFNSLSSDKLPVFLWLGEELSEISPWNSHQRNFYL